MCIVITFVVSINHEVRLMTTTANMQKKHISKLIALILIGASLSLPSVSMAQDGADNHRVLHQRIKNNFDKDGNGVLNGREAFHAREFHARWHITHAGPAVRPHRRHPNADRQE